jgi:hypothetical protein
MTAARTLCLAAVAAAFWFPRADGQRAAGGGPTIRLAQTRAGARVEVTHLGKETLLALGRLPAGDAAWARVLRVLVDRPGKAAGEQQAVLGAVRLAGGVLFFEPRFPLAAGVRYRVAFSPRALPAGKGTPTEAVLSLPKAAPAAATVVAQVYPTADKLPENQLKFYLHFSAPMRQGDSYRHIRLLDAKGKPVALPFLELDQELWDRSGTRLTVFIDPGRIKRGLKPREDAGPVLEEGKRYTLAIDPAWRDAEGAPLKAGFRKPFSVGAPLEKPADEKDWKLAPPAAGGRSPLRVTFPRPMDHALLHRMLWVVDAGGKKVPGTVAVSGHETVWQFTPAAAWREGTHSLVADRQLEDLAGNGVGRPFELDVLRPIERAVKTETARVAFEVKKAAR